MKGAGKHDDIVTEVREHLEADGVFLMVIGGERGNGVSCQGTLMGNLEMASLLEKFAEHLRKDAIEAAQEEARESGIPVDAVTPEKLAVPNMNPPDPDNYVPMSHDDVLAVSWEVLGIAQTKTQIWDEGLHALAFAIGGMRAAREAFGDDDDPDYAKKRVEEVMDFVLNKVTLVACEGGPEDTPGITAVSVPTDPMKRN